MNEQEAEFEVARRYVRLASTAARNAAMAPPTAPAGPVARAAVISAARRHAPGLLRGTPYQRRYGVRQPVGGFRTRRPAGADRRYGYRGRGTPYSGGPRGGPSQGARGHGARGYGGPSYGGPGYGGPSYGGPGYGGPSYGGPSYGYPGAGYGEPGVGYPGAGYGDQDDQGLPIPGAGRWIRRGRKIVLLGL